MVDGVVGCTDDVVVLFVFCEEVEVDYDRC